MIEHHTMILTIRLDFLYTGRRVQDFPSCIFRRIYTRVQCLQYMSSISTCTTKSALNVNAQGTSTRGPTTPPDKSKLLAHGRDTLQLSEHKRKPQEKRLTPTRLKTSHSANMSATVELFF